MTSNNRRVLAAKEAAQYLGVSLATLRKIERAGGLVPSRTPGGHRRYSVAMLDEYFEMSRREETGSRELDSYQPDSTRGSSSRER